MATTIPAPAAPLVPVGIGLGPPILTIPVGNNPTDAEISDSSERLTAIKRLRSAHGAPIMSQTAVANHEIYHFKVLTARAGVVPAVGGGLSNALVGGPVAGLGPVIAAVGPGGAAAGNVTLTANAAITNEVAPGGLIDTAIVNALAPGPLQGSAVPNAAALFANLVAPIMAPVMAALNSLQGRFDAMDNRVRIQTNVMANRSPGSVARVEWLYSTVGPQAHSIPVTGAFGVGPIPGTFGQIHSATNAVIAPLCAFYGIAAAAPNLAARRAALINHLINN